MKFPQYRWCSRAVFLFLLIALTSVISASVMAQTPMSREEQIVRTAYAKLAYAAQVREIERILREYPDPATVDRGEFVKRLHDVEITFEFSNMRVGNIEEINNTKYSELATKPSGDVLRTSPGYYNYTYEGKEVRSGIIDLEWIKGQQNFIEDWDMPYKEVARLGREEKTNLSTYTRYASYSMTATFQQKSRSYRAMFLFGAKPDGTEDILPLDLILNVNGGGLGYFRKESAYPGSLLHEKRNVGVIAEWLQSNQITAPGGKQDVECDLVKLKCGVASEDLRRHKPVSTLRKPGKQIQARQPVPAPRLVLAAYRPPVSPMPTMLGDACSGFNTSSGPTAYATLLDQSRHVTGGHFMSGNTSKSCVYSGSAGACNSRCNVDVGGTWNESGFVSSSCHVGDTKNVLGDNSSNGPDISCLGAAGGAVTSCLACNCSVDISITVLGTGVKVSSSNAFYTVEKDASQACGKQTVAGGAGGGGGGGDGCSGNGVGNTGGATALSDGSSTDSGTTCGPGAGSPIIIDTEGEGFHLTSADKGVLFDIRGDGHPVQIAWTGTGFRNAFLALPGTGGLVHNGKELFGNFTEQPVSNNPNGFLALAEFDKPENGGNGDDIIDEHDAVYSRLRLWIDANHDGVSQPEELHTLAELGVYALALDYHHSQRTDQFGNQFRFKTRVNPGGRRDRRDESSEVGRWTYDVFFVTKQ